MWSWDITSRKRREIWWCYGTRRNLRLLEAKLTSQGVPSVCPRCAFGQLISLRWIPTSWFVIQVQVGWRSVNLHQIVALNQCYVGKRPNNENNLLWWCRYKLNGLPRVLCTQYYWLYSLVYVNSANRKPVKELLIEYTNELVYGFNLSLPTMFVDSAAMSSGKVLKIRE